MQAALGATRRERGKFITLEGGEGVGKSTQARTLAARLRARGEDVLLTREPGGSPFAERLREALISEKGRALNASEQAILFAAARADHVESAIRPALEAGSFVICDRFTDSTEAYQGAGGASPGMTEILKLVAVGDLKPDLTVILDLPPEIGLERARARDTLDPFEEDGLAVQNARREAFAAIARREPQRCVVVDAAGPAESVADALWHHVAERLLPFGPAA